MPDAVVTVERMVSGSVVLADSLPAPGGLLIVRVEDVSRADAAARPVAEVRQSIEGPRAAGSRISFSVRVPAVDPAIHYQVRAHLSSQGKAEVESGDLLSTAAYPVLTFGHAETAAIAVERI